MPFTASVFREKQVPDARRRSITEGIFSDSESTSAEISPPARQLHRCNSESRKICASESARISRLTAPSSEESGRLCHSVSSATADTVALSKRSSFNTRCTEEGSSA